MKYKRVEMNEIDLLSNFSKEQLEEILKIQIQEENYEGAKVVKSAIDQYDDTTFDYYFEVDEDCEEDEDQENEDDI